MSRQRGNPFRPWWLEAYYGPGGRKGGKGRVGEREGDLVIAIEFGSETLRQMDLDILKAREDVGDILTGYNDGRGLR